MRVLSFSVVCLCAWLSHGLEIGVGNHPVMQTRFRRNTSSPLEFPKKSADSSTPIIIGNDPKTSHLPPKMFPSGPTDHNSPDPPVLSGSEANITEIENNSHEAKPNPTHVNVTSASSNSTVTKEAESPEKDAEKPTGEQDDMLHSKYKGGQDVDEMMKPNKKATERDEKKPVVSKKDPKSETEDPKSEIETSKDFDKNGPKSMNETKTKSGESMLESTSKMMAVSSSVLSSTKARHRGIIEPAKTVASVLLSIAVVLCLGVIGLLVWKKISMRRFGRDVLINEDDFDEVSDMHTFDRAQIQIT